MGKQDQDAEKRHRERESEERERERECRREKGICGLKQVEKDTFSFFPSFLFFAPLCSLSS